MGCKFCCQVDCCRPVRSANDRYGSGFLERKAEYEGSDVSNENTELCTGSDNEGFRIGNEWLKIGHSSQSKED